MIPLKEAINSGAWFHFEIKNGKVRFRVKFLSFEKLDLSRVDNPVNIKDLELGIWFILTVEFINLCKERIATSDWIDDILLKDQDGFEFNEKTDMHLSYLSEFAEKSGLDKFYSEYYIPKIKYKGAISFLLPNESEQEYLILVKDGSIQEI